MPRPITLLIATVIALSCSTTTVAQTSTDCDWIWGPELIGALCQPFFFGPSESQIKLKVYYGIEECTTTVYEEVCCEVPITITIWMCIPNIPPLPPSYVPLTVTLPGTTFEYKNQKVSCTTSSHGVVLYGYCALGEVQFSKMQSLFSNSQEATLTTGNHITLIHNDANPISFDGAPFAAGTEIALSDLELGVHSLTYTQPDGNGGTVEYTLKLNVTDSFPARQVDTAPGSSTLPSGVFEFTNNSPDALDVMLSVTPVGGAVDAQISDNIVHVMPGQSIQRTVKFTTTSGFALGDGTPACARVDVHPLDTSHAPIASAVIQTASYETLRGSGEDLVMETYISSMDTRPRGISKTARTEDGVKICLASPHGTFLGEPAGVFVDDFDPAVGITRLTPTLPGYHLSASATMMAPLAPLTSQGFTFVTTLAPQLQGSVFRIQGVALTSTATNGRAALTDAHDILVF